MTAAPGACAPAASSPGRTRALATGLLVAVTAVWGSTFPLLHSVVQTVPGEDFLGVRFTLAAVVMLAVLHRRVRRLDAATVRAGLLLGAVYGTGQLLQTVGLEQTPASRSGFLTGLYVVLTPVLGAVLLGVRVPRATWPATALALAGTAVLSLGSVGFGVGEALTIASAGVYALHIVLLGRFAGSGDDAGLAAVQIGACAVVCGLASLPGGVTTPADGFGWGVLVYMALVAGAAAMWAQTWAQRHLPAARTAIVMTTEPVFAAGFAVAFGGEHVTWRMLLGGALVLAGMYVVELGDRATPVVPEQHHEVG